MTIAHKISEIIRKSGIANRTKVAFKVKLKVVEEEIKSNIVRKSIIVIPVETGVIESPKPIIPPKSKITRKSGIANRTRVKFSAKNI
jgi:hypothetical protein